ncbi:hypothetical protein CYMTET_37182 [Cymbomonas tetramitiformis]|uniref:Uncharacterized protein n=1 Tax=Cymbomonas tetramitiformis TaxID=36881 RepID=A0AAE0CEE8_9CHLO|nr:hypothetical protein CYMTET_37182 [Cymbomonas tetramitiformis]
MVEVLMPDSLFVGFRPLRDPQFAELRCWGVCSLEAPVVTPPGFRQVLDFPLPVLPRNLFRQAGEGQECFADRLGESPIAVDPGESWSISMSIISSGALLARLEACSAGSRSGCRGDGVSVAQGTVGPHLYGAVVVSWSSL